MKGSRKSGNLCRRFFLILIVFSLAALIAPAFSHAAAPPGADIHNASLFEICEKEYDANGNETGNPRKGFTNKIVTCIEDVLIKTVDNAEFQNIRDQIQGAIGIILIFYIVLLGAEVALGKWDRPMAEMVGHILKVSLVCFFTMNIGLDLVYPMLTSALKSFTDMVSQHAGAIAGGKCSADPAGAFYTVWQRVDCVFASILAADLTSLSSGPTGDLATEPYEQGAKTPFVLPAAVVGLIFSSVGIVILALAIITIVIILIAVASAVVYYLMCLVAVIVLTIVAPIFVPMILFQPTKNIFDTWFQAIISYIIQPAILFAYLAFMTQAMTIVVYGTGSPDAKFGLHNTLEKAKGILDDPNRTAYEVFFESDTELVTGVTVDPTVPVTGKNQEAQKSGVTGPVIQLSRDEIAELLVNLIVVAMLAALLNSFMFNVMAFGGMLAGIPVTFHMGGFTRSFSGMMGFVRQRFM